MSAARMIRAIVIGPCLALAVMAAGRGGAWAQDQPPAASTPAPVTLAPEQWREDLRVLIETIATSHRNAFFATPRKVFDAAAADLNERIPHLTPHEIAVGFMQIAAMLHDGHTLAAGDSGRVGFRQYPLGFHWFSDGIYVIASPIDHASLRGMKVLAIGNMPIEEAIERVSTVFPHENQSQLRQGAVRYLVVAEVLHATGVLPGADRAAFVLRDAAGAESSIEFEARAAADLPKIDLIEVPDLPLPALGYRRFLGQRRPQFHWFEAVPDLRLLYVRYDRCADDAAAGRTVSAFAVELLEYIDGHATGIDRLVIDLRRNGGGNSALARPLIQGLRARESVNRRGRLFVLIGRGTFSSAQLNAHELRRDTEAILVGEPTGQKPNAYGEVKSFTLPHSRIRAQYSTKHFHTDDADPPSMMPDVAVEVSYADFAAGRDPVMEAVIAHQAEAANPEH